MYNLLNFLKKHHRIRKEEEPRSAWKESWDDFNEKYFGFLEHGVTTIIPWAVIILVIILYLEHIPLINVFNWSLLEKSYFWFENNLVFVNLIDRSIISLFVIELYFNFFKKNSTWTFLKTSFFDLLAIAPLGVIFKLFRVQKVLKLLRVKKVQSTIHVATQAKHELRHKK